MSEQIKNAQEQKNTQSSLVFKDYCSKILGLIKLKRENKVFFMNLCTFPVDLQTTKENYIKENEDSDS